MYQVIPLHNATIPWNSDAGGYARYLDRHSISYIRVYGLTKLQIRIPLSHYR